MLIKRIVRKLIGLTGYRLERIPHAEEVRKQRATQARKVVQAYCNGHCFKCYAGTPMADCMLSGQPYDHQLNDILKGISGGGDVIEIGANVGASLVPIMGKYPELMFHCIEPVPDFFTLLQENVTAFGIGNAKLYDMPLADRDGVEIDLFVQNATAGAVPEYDGHVPLGAVRKTAKTIDSLFGDARVKMIKLDVDGYEYQVLAGARKTIERCRPVIFMEFHVKLMKQMGFQPEEFIKLFRQFGYRDLTIWDNYGVYITKTGSYEQLLEIANEVPYYVDVLFK